MENMLKVGDKAVYPGHGVGQITSIEDKNIMGSRLTCYSMKIMESDTKIMIPKNRLESIGVRPVASKQQAKEVMGILSSEEYGDEGTKQKKLAKKIPILYGQDKNRFYL